MTEAAHMDIKVGDVVTLKAKVVHTVGPRLVAALLGSGWESNIRIEDIISVETRPLTVGERVTCGGIYSFEVAHIRDGQAMLADPQLMPGRDTLFEPPSPFCCPVNELRRAAHG